MKRRLLLILSLLLAAVICLTSCTVVNPNDVAESSSSLSSEEVSEVESELESQESSEVSSEPPVSEESSEATSSETASQPESSQETSASNQTQSPAKNSSQKDNGGATEALNPDSGNQPTDTPKPVPPENQVVNEKKELKCTLSISCKTILDNMGDLTPGKEGLVPADGMILSAYQVTFSEGESVFDVLVRETQKKRIHMEYSEFPAYNSAYIEGINNLYEFDCGELSGWMYKVNGWFPNYGCSQYQLKDGDVIEWVYTCDLGRDNLGREIQ